MALLFVIALVLAWPTFGLSIVAWFVLLFFKSKGNAEKINRREEVKSIIEPLFQEQFSDFFMALDMPLHHGCELTKDEAHQCGRHVMSYLSHNPSEAAIFMQGLKKWATKGSSQLCDPATAAGDEKNYNAKGEIHLTAYRAVEAIMTNNNSFKCFHKIELGSVMANRLIIDMKSL